MQELMNPIRLSSKQTGSDITMTVELKPDAIDLRAAYRGLIVHLHNVAEPIFWDLQDPMTLVRQVPALGASRRIIITCYGVATDNSIRLVYRNWG